MPLSIYFRPKAMNLDQYNAVLKKLQETGAGASGGRLYHLCFGDKNGLNVFDIWDTKENFEKFRNILMPILQQENIDVGEPEINEVYNIIKQ